MTHGPIVIEVSDDDDATTPSTAPMVLDDTAPEATAVATATRLAARPVSWLARVFWLAVVSLLLMWVSTAAWDFVAGLLDRNLWLGRAALVAGAVVVAVAGISILKELAGLSRLATLDAIRADAQAARADGGPNAAKSVEQRITRLYAGRADLAWARADLARMEADIIDGPARLDLLETTLIAPLDALAEAEVRSAARQVAAATALVPLTFADILVALTANVRMIRRVADVYGGRSGRVGSFRLLRAVATHLVATGAVGIADDMVGTIVGGGAVARISRRFGEGVINGALTARLGITAMDLARPMPFVARPRPGVTAVVKRALTGLFVKNT